MCLSLFNDWKEKVMGDLWNQSDYLNRHESKWWADNAATHKTKDRSGEREAKLHLIEEKNWDGVLGSILPVFW